MKKEIQILVLLVCCMASCQNNKQEQPSGANQDSITGNTSNQQPAAAEPFSKTFTVRPGVRIRFTESHPVGMSMSDVEAVVEGDVSGNFSFKDIDPVEEILEGDMDNNGNKEWYIITRGAGSGSYGNIKALASLPEDKIDEILIPDMNAGEGYMGHDNFTIDGENIIRKFPLYKQGDSNDSPTGGEREIRYRLILLGGSKYALDPVP